MRRVSSLLSTRTGRWCSVNSSSIGFGFKYKATDNIQLGAGYFQTNYEDYDRVSSTSPRISDSFTRTNRVLGINCELNF